MNRSRLTRLLHLVLALAIVNELVTSRFLHQRSAGGGETLAFELHEIVGLASLAIVLLFWLWSMVRRGEVEAGAMYPWLSLTRLRAVGADIGEHAAAIRRLRLPSPDLETPLASAVHGLGILIIAAIAATGALWWFVKGNDPAFARQMLELHEGLSIFAWIYLVGHASLAVIHEFHGDRVFGRMFSLGRAKR